VANYGGGNFALFRVGADARLQPATTVVQGDESPAGPSTTAVRLGHMVDFDANNRFMLAADKGLDRLLVYRFDASKGILTPHRPPSAALPIGSGPRHFALDPTGRWLIAANQQSGTLAVFSVDQNTGRLLPVGPLTSVASPVNILFM
jgi:6-phosphogluconolactonase